MTIPTDTSMRNAHERLIVTKHAVHELLIPFESCQ